MRVMVKEVNKEMDKKMRQIQELKAKIKQFEKTRSMLEKEVIDFLLENEDEYKTTTENGVEILQYIGLVHQATYSPQERETLKKEEVKELLSSRDYRKVCKISRYNVLRIK